MDSAAMHAAERAIEVSLLEPLFAPLESELGPVAATAFGPMVQQLLERADGRA